MPKKILLIEADAAFAAATSAALEGHGFDVRVTGDGKEGLDLARDDRPDAVVLCVELPKMSGYSICQKLKKDEALKSIPVVLISAEATPETFEQHRKLKARAEEYLLKPFAPEALTEKLSSLVGPPELSADEDVVTLEEEMALDTLGGEGSALPPIDLSDSPDLTPPPMALGLPEQDEELKLLDEAFESIAAEPPAGSVTDEPPVSEAEVEMLGEETAVPVLERESAALREPPRPERKGPQERVASDRSIADLRASRAEARKAAERAAAAERELAAMRVRLEEAERALHEKNAEAAQAADKVEMLEHELEGMKTDLVVARGEAEGARTEVDRRTTELLKRVSELEAQNANNEERVVKAYQKIKADEKIREKTRKALNIALQLLDEPVAASDPAEKEPRPAARD